MDYKVKIKSFNDVAKLKQIPGAHYNAKIRTWHFPKTPEVAKRLSEIYPEEIKYKDDILNFEFMEDVRKLAQLNKTCSINEIPKIHNTKIEPWEHQKRGYHFIQTLNGGALFFGMGAGKSKVTIDILNNRPDLERVLIICPCSVINVWNREFKKQGTDNYNVILLPQSLGTMQKKIKKIDQMRNFPGRLIVVVNYDTFKQPKMFEKLSTLDFQGVICDESHNIKSNSDRNKKVIEFSKNIYFKMCLTGTPMTNTPEDIFYQFKFLDPSIFGNSVTKFRTMYGRPLYQVNGGLATIYDWTTYADQLHEQIEKISYTVKTEDVIDLPEKRHEEIIVEMSKNVTNAYKELKYEMWTELQGKEIIVSTQLTNLLRLQQLANGIITIDGKTQQVDNVKEVALTELLEGIDPVEPVVVFSKFTKDLEIIENVARKLKRRYGEVSGKRKDLDENAEIPEGIQVMGVQLQAGGVGIDFTKARYCVYYSVGYNAADYEQSLARVHRPGQNKKVIYYHLIAKDTIDETIYDCLEKKGDLAKLVLEGIKNGNNTGC